MVGEMTSSIQIQKVLFPKFLTLLALLVLIRGPHVIKVRDVVRFLGVDDLGTLTWLGRILNLLAREGLAVRLNSGRPRRYRLKEWVATRMTTYGFRCFRGLQCPHIPECPIRKALKGVIKHDYGL